MMKKTILLTPIIATAIVSLLFSCVDSEKNLYDSSYKTANPMGDGLAAPDDFSWATTSTIKTTVEVNASANNNYYYTVELYDTNPIISSSARLLGGGVTTGNQPLVSEISIDNTIKTIFVKEIAPTGLTTIRSAEVTNGTANCSFKTSTPSVRSASPMTRAAANIPNTDDTSIFPIVAPEGIAEFRGSQNASDNTSYKVTSSTTKINLWQQNVKLYITEDITLDEQIYLAQNSSLYILPGKKVTMPKSTNNGQSGCMISIGKGASLIIKDKFQIDSNYKVYNLGTINASDLSYTNQSFVYNGVEAVINITGTLNGTNSESTIINDGAITANTISLEGNSHFINQKSVEVKGETIVNSTEASWENTGEWVTGEMSMSAWNSHALNRCKLIVKNKLTMGEATLINDGDAYVQCKDLYMNNSTVELGSKSLFEVTELATYGYQDPSKGFKGTGTEKALVVIKKAVAETLKANLIHYSGTLQVICSDHPTEKIDNWNICWTMTGGAEWAEEGKNTVSIPQSECNNGYNGGTPTPPTNPNFPIVMDDNHNYTYLFEDMWPLYGDYDMNDIVMTIRHKHLQINNENKVQEFQLSIDLNAVGATKAIGAAIMLDGVPASSITQAVEYGSNTNHETFQINNFNIEAGQDYAVIPLFDEAHKMLGGNSYEQINTINGSSQAIHKDVKNITFTIKFNNPSLSPEAFNINKLNLFIIVDGNNNKRKEIHVAGYQPTKLANTDLFGGNNDASSVAARNYYISKENLAWGIIVPTQFKWPLEYVNIKNAYSQFFDWVTSGGKENQHWWNDFDVNKVFQTNKN